MGEVCKLFIFHITIEFFSIRQSWNLKILFLFLKKTQTGENNPSLQKAKIIFTKHQNHELFHSLFPLIYLQRTSEKY